MNLLPKLPGVDLAWSAIPIAFVIYALLLLDARRKDSASADDDQLGIKTVAATLALVSTLLLAMGLRDLLHLLLTFSDFWDRFKVAIPGVLVGALGVGGTAMVLFPKTNAAEYPKAKRLAAGIVALVSGIAFLPALAGFITALLDFPSWKVVAGALATTLDALLVFGASFAVLGKLSGIVTSTPKPEAPAGPPPGQPMPGQPMQAPPVQGQQQPMPGQGYPQQPAPPAQGYPQQPAPPTQGYPQQPAPPAQGYPGQPPGPGGWGQG